MPSTQHGQRCCLGIMYHSQSREDAGKRPVGGVAEAVSRVVDIDGRGEEPTAALSALSQVCIGLPHTPEQRVQLQDAAKQLGGPAEFKVRIPLHVPLCQYVLFRPCSSLRKRGCTA
jgi:hypothetical protein